MRHDQGQKDAYGTSTEASNDKNGDGKVGQKGKQEDRHGAEFETENRVEWKLEWNGKSEARETEQKGKKPWKWKGKWSMGKNRMETWKEEIWDITLL